MICTIYIHSYIKSYRIIIILTTARNPKKSKGFFYNKSHCSISFLVIINHNLCDQTVITILRPFLYVFVYLIPVYNILSLYMYYYILITAPPTPPHPHRLNDLSSSHTPSRLSYTCTKVISILIRVTD